MDLNITKQAKYYVVMDNCSIDNGKVFRDYDTFEKYMFDTYNIEECFINTEYDNNGGLLVYID